MQAKACLLPDYVFVPKGFEDGIRRAMATMAIKTMFRSPEE